MKRLSNIGIVFLSVLFLAGCAAKKPVADPSVSGPSQADNGQDEAKRQLQFVQKVYDQQLYQKNIVADCTFTAQTRGKEMSLPGSLHMRKDQVVRLQLFIPLIGTEVGRLEFTPDHVLVIDRMHKEYIKADYSELNFLKENGLTFYSLQSLFWNQLFVPDKQRLTESELPLFKVDWNTSQNANALSLEHGKMVYNWQVQQDKGLIEEIHVDYQSQSHGATSLEWLYGDFRPFGSRQYPLSHRISFNTAATAQPQKAAIRIQLAQPTAAADWEPESAVSAKYKKVEAKDILGKLLSL